jgi:biotin operon repressor
MLFINCKLDVKTALGYSLILRRFNLGKGASRRYLAAMTHMDRQRTIKPLVETLLAKRLISQNPRTKMLWPLPPDEETKNVFYLQTNEDKPWWKRFTFFKFRLRSAMSPLSQTANILYWKLKDLERQGKKWQTNRGLATLLRCSRSTIKNAIESLTENGLLLAEASGVGFAITTLLPPEKEEWFYRAKKRKKNDKPASPSKTDATAEPNQAHVEENEGDWRTTKWSAVFRIVMDEDPSNKWLQNEWPEEMFKVCYPLYLNCISANYDWHWLHQLIKGCQAQHRKTGTAPTCAWMVLDKVRKIAANDGRGGFVGQIDRPLEQPYVIEEAVRRVDEATSRKPVKEPTNLDLFDERAAEMKAIMEEAIRQLDEASPERAGK